MAADDRHTLLIRQLNSRHTTVLGSTSAAELKQTAEWLYPAVEQAIYKG
jgi:hypothetical protein